MQNRSILVVDDEEIMREVLKNTLLSEGFSVDTAENGFSAFQAFQKKHYDLVISDLQMTGMDGITLLKRIKEIDADVMVIIMTAFGSIETAVTALKSGAFDFLTKPFIENEIKVTLRNAFRQSDLARENKSLKLKLQQESQFHDIIGKSHVMKKIFRIIEKVAKSDTNILITGDSGTGKELVANAIHYSSHRKNSAMISVNCSSIPDTLMESEMFGHVKGAFTNAYLSKQGLFEEAHKGTLFLDEIADLSLFTQAKLLRAIQKGEIKPVGGTKTRNIDARIISATNKNLETEVKERRFREDLYYRLNVVNIHLPPLRERAEDIPALSQHFLNKYCEKYNVPLKKLNREALKTLLNYSWAGNVRELENYMERAVALSEGDEITNADLPPSMTQTKYSPSFDVPKEGINLNETIAEYESSLILRTLDITQGNITKAAELLHIPRRTLSSRIQKLGLNSKRNI